MKSSKNMIQAIETRKWLLFVCSFTVLVCLSSMSIYGYHIMEKQAREQEISIRETGQVKMYASILNQTLDHLKSDVLSLSGHHLIPEFLAVENNEISTKIGADFLAFCRAKKYFDQIRIISAEGCEKLGINNDGSRCRMVPHGEHQSTAHRNYTKDALAMRPGSIFLSEFDLNRAHNEIETPYKPVLRLATPLADRYGRKAAALVFNYRGEDLFTRMETARQTGGGSLMLLNRNGYWLKAPWPESEWGFMIPGRAHEHFPRRFPDSWRKMLMNNEGQARSAHGLFTFASVHPHKTSGTDSVTGSRRWIVVSWVSPYEMRLVSHGPVQKLWYLWVVFMVLSLPIAWLLTFVISRWRAADEQVRILSRFPSESPNPVFRIKSDGRLAYANPVGEKILYPWGGKEGMVLPEKFACLAKIPSDEAKTKGVEIPLGDRIFWFLVAPLADTGDLYIYGRDVTDLKQARDTLKYAEERYRLLSEEAPVSIMTFDTDGRITFVNNWHLKKFCKAMHDRQFYIGKPIDHLPGLSGLGIIDEIKKVLTGQEVFLQGIYTKACPGCHANYQNIRAVPFRKHGKVSGGIIIREDITEIKNAHGQLELASQIFENAIERITITDEKGTIQFVNNAFSKITGYSKEEAVGKNPRILKSDRHSPEFYEKMWNRILTTGQWRGEIWNRRKNGEAYPEWLSISTVRGRESENKRYVGLFHDRSDLRRAEKEIKYKSDYDALTGLFNRHVFKNRLNSALMHVKPDWFLAVYAIDIDNFKAVNNSLGHQAGDELLHQIARRIESAVNEQAVVSRLGGDEFLVLIGGLKQPSEANQWAQRLLSQISGLPYTISDNELFVTVSIGIAIAPTDGNDADYLIKNSDMTAVRFKRKKRNGFAFFSGTIAQEANKNLELENALYRALENDEFRVYFQPKVDLVSGCTESMEALVRWERTGIGLVPPDEFVPLAEATGLIVPIGESVLRSSCRMTRKLKEAGYGNLCVAVNLSVKQLLEPNLLNTVETVLEETGLSVGNLEFEVTESAFMADIDVAENALKRLHAMGIKISLDDFGTGYSSLSYLKRLPIDSVKIDKSFIDDIPEAPDANAVAAAIISMAHSLNLKVVAEGVETQEQLDFLRNNRCDLIQGYYYSPPLPFEKFTGYIAACRRLY